MNPMSRMLGQLLVGITFDEPEPDAPAVCLSKLGAPPANRINAARGASWV
jgi:hypothetical protein